MKNLELFKKSFQNIDARFLWIMVYDALFYALLFVFLYLWSAGIQNFLLPVNLGNLNLGSFESLAQQRAMLRQNVANLLLLLFLLALLIFFSWTLSRSLIYSKILNKKFNILFWMKFTLLKFINMLIFLIPFLIAFRTFLLNLLLGSILLYLFLFLLFHFGYVSYINFTIKNKISYAMKQTFKIAFGKIHKFIIPYIFVIIIIAIIALANQLILLSPKIIATILQYFISFAFLAWLRFYLVSVVKNISKQ